MNNTKYERHMEKLRAKAPNNISYEDCWDLRAKLASIIAEHLRAFIYWEKNSPFGGIPGSIYQKSMDTEKGLREWLGILRKMLYSFEAYQSNYNPEAVDDEENKQQYDKERVKEGMQLFVDYWDCLWI